MRVAMPKVNREALANCPMWFPKVLEQSRILDFVAHESRPIDSAISRLEREIELVREYRTRLVADVVTGKSDVREAAIAVEDDDADLIEEVEPAEQEASE
jgi:type I restriction enzyme, S subunit